MLDTKLNFEIKRKLFHLCSLIFPIIYFFTPKVYMCIALVVITSVTLSLDISRHYNVWIKKQVELVFRGLLRQQENSNQLVLSGASYMAMGFLLSGLLFSKGLAITSWLVLIISDCCAAIIGIKYGVALENGKSWAGSAAFLLSAIFISIMTYFAIGYSTSFIIIVLSSLLTAIAEFFSHEINVDDNLSIPMVYASSTVLLGLLM